MDPKARLQQQRMQLAFIGLFIRLGVKPRHLMWQERL